MRLGFREKITLAIVLTTLIVSFILSAVFYRRSVSVFEQTYSESVANSLEVCAETFDDLMLQTYYTAVNAATDTELQSYIKDLDSKSESKLYSVLERYCTSNIDSVYCYIEREGKLIKATSLGTQTQNCSAQDVSWLWELRGMTDNPLSPVSTIDEVATIEKQVFAYYKPIADSKTGETLGYIIVTVDERVIFFRCLQGHKHSGDGETYIATADGIYASCSNLKKLGMAEEPVSDDYIETSVEAPMSNYILTSVVDRSIITGDIRDVRKSIILIAVLLVFLSSIPVLLLVRSMMRPVKQLERTMEQISRGDLSVRAEIYHEDEIGKLSEGFNNMVDQIEALIEELVTERMLKKEAEIEALKYQITPHFIYNTLNSIKYAAVLQDAKEIAEQLEAFIELMQMSASDRGAFITIKQETHMVENYVKLQRFRYANSFEVSFDIRKDAEKCYIPGLIVQPLVENAILHGIDLKKPGGRIDISALCIAGTVAIKVTDNGKGMTAEELQKLLDGKQRGKFNGIGISNVRERIELYYGRAGRLEVFSESGRGTTALITLPISFSPEEYTI